MPRSRSDLTAGASKQAPVDDPRELLDRGLLNARAGQVVAALDYLGRAADADDGVLDELQRSELFATAIECRLARGELPAASSLGERLSVLLERPGLVGAIAHHQRGELCASAGDDELAAGHFARIPRLLADGQDDPDRLPWRVAAALASVRLGRRVEGTALAREHLALAGVTGAAYPIALGLRTLATVDAHTDRLSLLEQALDELDGVPAARLVAQIETDLAGLLLLTGPRENAPRALTLLRRAEHYAGGQGLWPLLGRVRRLLGRMDEEPLLALGEALATLTRAEQHVATLAAQGHTNREIAEQLGVTVKAVEWHLSRVYRKLGIPSRAALREAIAAVES